MDRDHSECLFGDASYKLELVFQQVMVFASRLAQPSTVYRPRVFIDGDQWCALYGENIQDGVCGFGPSPAEAMAAFDREWWVRLPENHHAKE